MHTLPYGPGTEQAGDLYLPSESRVPLVCLFHGGFWRMPYGRDQLDPMAADLCAAGFAVWNIGYRRVGPAGHPWPATLHDAEAAIAYLPVLKRNHPQVDLSRLFLVGHSAGGHLAFLVASKSQQQTALRPTAVIGLAPVLDLAAAYQADLGDGAVALFLGGSPSTVPERYQEASPRARLPLGVRQCILHGEADSVVPPSFSRAYVTAAVAAGDQVTYSVIRGADHMAFIDPASGGYAQLRRYLVSAA